MKILDKSSIIQIMNNPKGFFIQGNVYAPAEIVIELFENMRKTNSKSDAELEYIFTSFPVIRLPEKVSQYEKQYIEERSKAKGLSSIDYWAYLYSSHFKYPLIAGSDEKEKSFLKTGLMTFSISRYKK